MRVCLEANERHSHLRRDLKDEYTVSHFLEISIFSLAVEKADVSNLDSILQTWSLVKMIAMFGAPGLPLLMHLDSIHIFVQHGLSREPADINNRCNYGE